MEKLPGIGVFGTGPYTTIVVPYLRAAGFKLEAIWGKTAEEAQQNADELDIPFATNRVDDVLLRKNVDLILILSPPSLHSQIAVKALGIRYLFSHSKNLFNWSAFSGIGKHVAVQCPAGISQSETLRQVQAAQYYPSLLSLVVYCLRFLPAVLKLRKAVLEDDLIGPVTMCDVRLTAPSLISDSEPYSWACDNHMGGGILNQFGSHIIDLLNFTTGLKAKRVHGTVRTLSKQTSKINGIRQINSDDVAVFQLECDEDNITTVNLNGACASTEFKQELHFHGTKGDLFVSSGTLVLKEKKGSEIVETVLHHEKSEDELPNNNFHPRLPPIYRKGISLMFRHLAENLRNGSVEDATDWWSFANFNDALYVQAVMEAIRASSKDKVWTKVIVVEDSADPSECYSSIPGSGIFTLI